MEYTVFNLICYWAYVALNAATREEKTVYEYIWINRLKRLLGAELFEQFVKM